MKDTKIICSSAVLQRGGSAGGNLKALAGIIWEND